MTPHDEAGPPPLAPDRDGAPTAGESGPRGLSALPRWVPWVPVLAALLAFTFTLGWVGHERSVRPGSGSVDVGFLRDMTAHHDQAVEMALLAMEDRGADPLVTQFASEILLSQRWELGRMYTWLTDWGHGLGDADRPPMAWMDGGGHVHTDDMTVATMPGMQTNEAMDALEAARGRDFDRRFLTMMRAHHNGGIPMADHAAEHAGNAEVRRFATRVAEGQRGEVNDYTAWLRRLDLE